MRAPVNVKGETAKSLSHLPREEVWTSQSLLIIGVKEDWRVFQSSNPPGGPASGPKGIVYSQVGNFIVSITYIISSMMMRSSASSLLPRRAPRATATAVLAGPRSMLLTSSTRLCISQAPGGLLRSSAAYRPGELTPLSQARRPLARLAATAADAAPVAEAKAVDERMPVTVSSKRGEEP